MANAIAIVTNLLIKELENINNELEADQQEWLEETDWMPKKERAVTYKTRPIDKYKGNERYWMRRKTIVQRRLYEAGTMLLKRSPK